MLRFYSDMLNVMSRTAACLTKFVTLLLLCKFFSYHSTNGKPRIQSQILEEVVRII